MNATATSWPPSAADIRGMLTKSGDIPRGVSVTVRDGHITLKGVVGWHYERVRAQRAIKRLRGVKSVFNNIMVEPGVCAGER